MTILISPRVGAGWSTWNRGDVGRFMLTYKPIIEFIEAGGEFEHSTFNEDAPLHPLLKQLQVECRERFGADYVGVLGAHDLEVAEVTGRFFVREYDGSESIQTTEGEEWMDAE